MRDITLEETIYPRFTTRAFATGIPGTLGGSPVLSIYEENNTTQITAGVSVSVDYDSVTGLNQATIVATTANGYESGKSYDLVITTGTVDSVSVVGETVFSFTIGASAAAADLANGTDGLGAIKTDTAAVLVDTVDIKSRLPAALVGGLMSSDITAISTDSTAADNLELQYDTTGLSGDTFPATQAQVNNIGAASGGAVNIEATEDNTGGAIIDGVAFVGSVTGGTTYANTATQDSSGHTMDDTGNVIDIVYGFDIGGSRAATQVSIVANLNGNSDEILVKVYDHSGSAWDTIGTLLGSGGSSYTALDLPLLTRHSAGTSGELGKVYIRFDTDSTSPNTLDIDVCLVAAVSTSTSVGYANGAYWVDSAGTAGTEIGTNGTADNPCPWANAITMNGTQALNRFQIANGNIVTLAANSDNYTLIGSNWNLALGGQSIEGLAVIGTALITGIGTATVTPPSFSGCNFGAATIPPSEIRDCGIGNGGGTFTAGSAGQYLFINCVSEVPGSGSPAFVFSGLGATVGINNRGWKGGSTYTLDSDCTLSHEVLAGGGTTITTGGGAVEIRGITRSLTLTMSAAETVQFVGVTGPITLNGTTTATVNLYGVSASVTDSTSAATVTDGTVNQANINTEADTALSDYDPPTNAQMEARTLVAASYFDPAADTVANVTEVAQMAGTIGTLDALDTAQDTQHTSTQSDIAALNDLSAAQVNAEADTALADFFTSAAQLVSDFWDEILTGATHNTPTSAGRRLRELAGTIIISGTAAAGTANTITLDGDASTSDGAYDPAMVYIVAGTGLGQTRNILDYVGSTKIATVDRNWRTNPDATSEYIIGASAGREHVNEGLAQAGTSSTITLNTSASASDDAYINQTVFIRSGTGEDQARIVTDYNGTTKIATVGDNWATTPDTTSGYVMLPTHVYEVETIAEATRTEIDSNSTQLTAIVEDTNELQTDWENGGRLDVILDAASTHSAADVWAVATRVLTANTNLNDITVDDVLTTQMTQSYAANGVAPTLAEAVFAIHQKLMQSGYSSTSSITYELDNSTTAFTGTLDDATNPTEDRRV